MRTVRDTMRMAACAVFAAVLAVLAIAGPARAQDKTVQLKLSSWLPSAHPLNPALQAWAADIEKQSGGTICVRVVAVHIRLSVQPGLDNP